MPYFPQFQDSFANNHHLNLNLVEEIILHELKYFRFLNFKHGNQKFKKDKMATQFLCLVPSSGVTANDVKKCNK